MSTPAPTLSARRFRHVIEMVTSKPWLITPPAHATIRQLVESKLNGQANLLAELFGDPPATEITEEGIAIVPVKGVIGKGFSNFEKSCGAVDTQDISADLAALRLNSAVRGVLLDIDSPGGMVNGTPECADDIAATAEKMPVWAWTDGDACSAAYLLGSSANNFGMSTSAETGSIGVYMPWVDSTRAYEAAGYSIEVIKNKGGTFKGMGLPGTTLSEEQRAELQRGVDEIFAMFQQHVTDHRQGRVAADSMRGQTFLGESARVAGLVDEVTTRDKFYRDMVDWVNRHPRTS